MRIVGYVREAPVLGDSELAYAQREHIRRWCAQGGHQLVSVCQDLRTPGSRTDRDGYRAVLDIVRSGHVDGVLVSELAALSPDKVLQEVMIHDLRSHGIVVLSADPEDAEAMQQWSSDQTRMVVRDIVARVREYVDEYGTPPAPGTEPRVIDLRGRAGGEVIVELIPAEGAQPESAAQTARPRA